MTRPAYLPHPMPAIDIAVEAEGWPAEEALAVLVRRAFDATLRELDLSIPDAGTELSLVFTDDAAIQALNAQWRGKDKATNVLSFPAFQPVKGGPIPPLLGDIVLAYETVKVEALTQGRPLEHHVSHLVVHGLLHLIGYDHETDEEGDEMEALETRILARLAIPDPYA